MRSPVVIAVSCTVLGTGVFSQQASVVAITGGTLIDGNGGATIIDARGKFLMPGLVDTNVLRGHTHGG